MALTMTAGLTQNVAGARMMQSRDIGRQDEQRLSSQGWRLVKDDSNGRVFDVFVVPIGLGEVVAVHDGMKQGFRCCARAAEGAKPLQGAVRRNAVWG